MKIRSGFVSNSSTSSFICSACGGIEAERDACLSDFEMFRCENNHELHESCAGITVDASEEYLEEYVAKYGEESCSEAEQEEIREEARQEYIYEVPAKYCPICRLEILSDEDELKYYRYKLGVTAEETAKEVAKKFTNYKEFKTKIYQ